MGSPVVQSQTEDMPTMCRPCATQESPTIHTHNISLALGIFDKPLIYGRLESSRNAEFSE